MKRVVWNVLAGALIATALTACGGGSRSSGGGKSAKIKMTTEESGEFWFKLAGSGVATVDWGDGSEKVLLTLNEDGNVFMNSGGVIFEHDYPSATIRTVTINGDYITELFCRRKLTSLDVRGATALTSLAVYEDLTNLDVSKNTALTHLRVYGNLTNLDVSKNTALTELELGGNFTSFDVSKNTALTYLSVHGQLSAAALNALFGTLHSNTIAGEKITINIGDNPGAKDCDRSIAERKGWTMR